MAAPESRPIGLSASPPDAPEKRPALPYRLWLGPMAGYSDSAMRRVCHEAGAEASVSEMISAKAVVYRDKKTVALGRIRPEEGPVSLQLFGSEAPILAEAAAMLAGGYCGGETPAAIDLNVGCPVPKVAGNGEGSALMKTPEKCETLIRAMRAALPERLPLTAKIRLGWDDGHRNAVEVAEALEAGGVSAIFVHGRTRAAMYAGEADWEAIAEVAEAVRVPVIGNGDIRTPEFAMYCLQNMPIYGIMLARGAVGNPFLFTRIAARMRGEDCPEPSPAERAEAALRQLRYAIEDKGEAFAVREGRKQIACCFSGVPGAAACRAAIHTAETYADVEATLRTFLSGLDAQRP